MLEAFDEERDMDGVEVIRRARAHKPEIPVVLISGFTHALGLSESTTGADVVLQKSATESLSPGA